jgi:DNA-binding GntR family transcriptional regulator
MSEQKTLPSELAAKLRKDILGGKLPSGFRLTEIFISEKYAVSRTPVREALRMLDGERLIELLPNKGAVVIGRSKADIIDLYKILELLEVQAVRWAIERAEAAELDMIEQSLEFMEFYTRRKDTRRIRELGLSFHRNIWTAAHNKQLLRELSLYRSYLNESKHVKRISAADLNAIYGEHEQIFKAFVSMDEAKACEAMRLHIENAKMRTL